MIDFTICGLILIFSIIVITIFQNEEKVITLLIELNIIFSLFINIGYIFKIVGFEFNYYRIFMPITILIYLIKHKGSININKKYFVPIIILYLSCIFGLIFTFVFKISPDTYITVGRNYVGNIDLAKPYFTSRNIIRTIDLFTFILYLLILYDFGFFKQEKVNYFVNKFLLFTKAFFILLFIEFIFTYSGFGEFFRHILFTFFGQNSESVVISSYKRGGIYMLMGTLQEPSHIVFILLVLYTLYLKNYKISDTFIIFSWFIAFATTSSACVLCIPLSFIGYIYSNNIKIEFNKIFKIIMVFTGVILAIILFLSNKYINDQLAYTIDKFTQFIQLDINNMNLHTSADERSYSIYISFKAFLKNFVFGLGFGTLTTYSGLISLIANLGLVGSFSYIIMLYKLVNPKLDFRYILSIIFICLYMIGVGMLGTIYNILIILLILPTFCEIKSNQYLLGELNK